MVNMLEFSRETEPVCHTYIYCSKQNTRIIRHHSNHTTYSLDCKTSENKSFIKNYGKTLKINYTFLGQVKAISHPIHS